METILNILHKIQQELKAPKNQYNKFGEYNYRSQEDILEAVKPLLPEGVVVLLSDDIIEIAGNAYVKATASISSSQGTISTTSGAREDKERKKMQPEQLTGSSSSYARKYALNGLFAIDDTKDADSNEDAPKAPNPPKAELTPQQKLQKAKDTAKQIILEYKACTNLGSLADVQVKYQNELKAFNERYEELFKDINATGLQIIENFKNEGVI